VQWEKRLCEFCLNALLFNGQTVPCPVRFSAFTSSFFLYLFIYLFISPVSFVPLLSPKTSLKSCFILFCYLSASRESGWKSVIPYSCVESADIPARYRKCNRRPEVTQPRAGYFLTSRRFSAVTRGRTVETDVTCDVVLDSTVSGDWRPLARSLPRSLPLLVMHLHSHSSAVNRRGTDHVTHPCKTAGKL
jgi:hypothetical protein